MSDRDREQAVRRLPSGSFSRWRRQVLARTVILMFALTSSTPLRAEMPIARRVILMFRILAYDRRLPEREAETVTILVVYRTDSESSETTGRAIVSAAEQAARAITVSGLPVRVESAPYTTAKRFLASVKQYRATAVYVCPELEDHITEIAEMTRSRAILSMSGSKEFVEDGLSVGIVSQGEKATIVISLDHARAESVGFVPALLKLAEIIQ